MPSTAASKLWSRLPCSHGSLPWLWRPWCALPQPATFFRRSVACGISTFIHIRDSLLISLQISLHAAVLSTRCPTIHVRYSDVILESWVFLRPDPIDWVACHAKLACHVALRIPEEIRKKESSQAAALGIWGPPDAEFNWCEEAPFAEGQWQCLQAVRCAGWTEAKLSGPIEPQYHHRYPVKACNYSYIIK